ncbi:MerR family transcriptional regulator [Amycolatopsis sp. FDAARGOS 1241]|uniref:MerR family transcriptional regulator n=1 Tax=Amycolatopsis sp. FDAARGOS 1241 TaxID=2778070 RepID=UPI00194E6E77|nr:MerR family transcriptional regulator [Amycolatopsis sp. FDAARGOS 1241]QRP44788.1 MerR family transcriptional regulator [Amycolatopsis sp. FDAARGOS 1241]
MSEGLTVGRAAALVGVSVKTLHHWDAIGLVRPSERTCAGYRVYSGDDVARVHRVLVYRELGFPLAQIGRLLDDPAVDAHAHLHRQRTELVERIERLQTMVSAVDTMLAATKSGLQLTPEQQVEIFGSDWHPEWAGEAEDRWGDSPQWAQYAERAATMSPADWEKIAAEVEQLNSDLATARTAGITPGSPEANALAERHRATMAVYFDCPHARHVCLGRLLSSPEEGFAEYYGKLAPDLASWLRDAINANAEAHGVDPATATWD